MGGRWGPCAARLVRNLTNGWLPEHRRRPEHLERRRLAHNEWIEDRVGLVAGGGIRADEAARRRQRGDRRLEPCRGPAVGVDNPVVASTTILARAPTGEDDSPVA